MGVQVRIFDGNNTFPTAETINEMRNENVEIINFGNRVTVRSWTGVYVEFRAGGWYLFVRIDNCYKNNVDGLCGSWNDDNSDDFTDATGVLRKGL